MSDDTWNDIQAFKKRQSSLREKFQKRKKEREEIVQSLQVELPPVQQIPSPHAAGSSSSKHDFPSCSGEAVGSPQPVAGGSGDLVEQELASSASAAPSSTTTAAAATTGGAVVKREASEGPEVTAERRLLRWLCDVTLELPMDSVQLAAQLGKTLGREVPHPAVVNWLQKFSAQELITIREGFSGDGKSCVIIAGAEHTKLTAVVNELEGGVGSSTELSKNSGFIEAREKQESDRPSKSQPSSSGRDVTKRNVESIEGLLSMPSTREKESKKMGEEILDLLSKPTAKERCLAERFRSQGGAQVKEFCPHGTKEECAKLSETREPCRKLHFKKIIQKHTDESLGDCSFLNTCFHMDTCKYVHYEVDHSGAAPADPEKTKPDDDKENSTAALHPETKLVSTLYPQQWIQCDLRFFDMSILGKFAVVMADPPWDIHMELPYGTMSDNEMRQLNIPTLQEEGLIFLWVTGRAMELGRECLKLWGYERCDELIWVKTNQLQRIIRTGRTGHWLNHGKEHCLVGMKGNPASINRGLDCDVIVAEVRATSHKPDEIYGIIERLSPGTRKIELFGRPHNVQPNWITLGNQLDGVRVLDPELVVHFQERYPDGNCMAPPILSSKS